MLKITRRRFIQGAVGGSLAMILPLQGGSRPGTGVRLEEIYGPQVVGIPPVNAFNGLVRLESAHGVSYVHLQNTAADEDRAGVLVDWVEADGSG